MLKFKLNVAERKTLAKRMEELTGMPLRCGGRHDRD